MQIVTRVTSSDSLQEPQLPNWPDWPWWSDWPSYMIFVMNAVKAVRVKFECKQIPEEPEKYCFWQFCRKFTHFPSVKFSWLKMCACKKIDKYQVWIDIYCKLIWNCVVLKLRISTRSQPIGCSSSHHIAMHWWIDSHCSQPQIRLRTRSGCSLECYKQTNCETIFKSD